MKTVARVLRLLLDCCSLLLAHPAFSQGPLTPGGTPTPTMKTLTQIEPRTPIESLPFTITQPGSYYLTKNLAGVSGRAASSLTRTMSRST